MLTKMWISLQLCLLQIVINIIVVENHDNIHWYNNNTYNRSHNYHFSSNYFSPMSIILCLAIKTGIYHNHQNSCEDFNSPVDNSYLWFIIPQLLNGLSSLLVSMTVFEFICAQAPRTTQGLLIGLWYATFSIRYLVVGVLDNLITERRSWLIYEGVKGFLILVSLVLFSCVSRHYRYRQ